MMERLVRDLKVFKALKFLITAFPMFWIFAIMGAYVSLSQDFKHTATRICRQTEKSHLDSEWLWAAQSPAAVPGILVTAPRPVLGWMRVTVLPTWTLESVEETDREQILIP